MRIRWVCNCEERHTWRFFKEEGQQPDPAEEICPHGHPATICRQERPVDECAITIHPAAAVTDEASGHVMYQGFYYLVLANREREELRVSAKNYSLAEAFRLAERFLGRSRERAVVLWDSSPP